MSDFVRAHRRQPTRLPHPCQARTLEWVAISFSAWKWKVKVKSLSRVWLFMTPWTAAYQAPLSMGFPRQEYWCGMPLPSPKMSILHKAIKSLMWSLKITYDVFHRTLANNTEISMKWQKTQNCQSNPEERERNWSHNASKLQAILLFSRRII